MPVIAKKLWRQLVQDLVIIKVHGIVEHVSVLWIANILLGYVVWRVRAYLTVPFLWVCHYGSFWWIKSIRLWRLNRTVFVVYRVLWIVIEVIITRSFLLMALIVRWHSKIGANNRFLRTSRLVLKLLVLIVTHVMHAHKHTVYKICKWYWFILK